MSKSVYMLDTNICSFLIRNKPDYLLDKLQKLVEICY
jgi:predicted nucleic acid-binding protein